MIQNQYYYLVAGLPELIFDADNRKIDLQSIKNELKMNVVGDDLALLESLFLHYDNANLIAHLKGKSGLSELGNVPTAAYEELSENVTQLPTYMQLLLSDMNKEEEPSVEEEVKPSLEVDLLTRYYQYVDQYSNSFLKHWFKFDRQLRNILAAFSARKLDKEISRFVVGKDEVTEMLTKSLSPDFGLRGELTYMDKLMQAIEADNYLEREKKIDMLRWDIIDEVNTFNYFNIDKVLGFWIKAEIIDRWIKLDPAEGEALLKRYFSELKSEFNVNTAF